MEAIIFALIAFVGWGVGDLLVAITARRIESFSGSFWSMFLTVILFSPYAFSRIEDLSNLTLPLLLLNLFLGVILIGGIMAFREGFRIGNVALVGTIGSAFTVLTTIFGILFFNERLTIPQTITIMAIFIGLFLAMFNIQEVIKRKIAINRALLLALIAMITWGIYFAFIKIPIQEIGWFWPNYITFMLFPLLYIVMRIRHLPLLPITTNNAFIPLIISTLTARVAEFSFNIGISKGFISIVAPIAGASPVLLVILAFIFFKDPITKQQFLGITTTLVGIVLLSLF